MVDQESVAAAGTEEFKDGLSTGILPRGCTVIYFLNFGLMTVFEVILLRYDFQAYQYTVVGRAI